MKWAAIFIKVAGFSCALIFYLILLKSYGGDFGVVHAQAVWLSVAARSGIGFGLIQGSLQPKSFGFGDYLGRIFASLGAYFLYCCYSGDQPYLVLCLVPLFGLMSSFFYGMHLRSNLLGSVGTAFVPCALLFVVLLSFAAGSPRLGLSGVSLFFASGILLLLSLFLFVPGRSYFNELFYSLCPVAYVLAVDSVGMAGVEFFYFFKAGDIFSQFALFYASFGRREISLSRNSFFLWLGVCVTFSFCALYFDYLYFVGLLSALIFVSFYLGSYILVRRADSAHLPVSVLFSVSLLVSSVYPSSFGYLVIALCFGLFTVFRCASPGQRNYL